MPVCNIVLFEPEIPPNTGNIIRLAANTNSVLHIIEPLGFELDDKRLRRAGLDYGEWKDIKVHADWKTFIGEEKPQRLFAMTTKGSQLYHEVQFQENDFIVMGPETRGLPDEVLNHPQITQRVRIPMAANSRSMNLSNATAVIVYEIWRQQEFNNAL